MIEFSRTRAGTRVALQVTGRLDARGAASLEAEIDEALRAGARELELDLSGVPYLSSAGIRVLVKAHHELEGLGGSLGAPRSSAAVAAILETAGLAALLAAPAAPAEPAPRELSGTLSLEVVDTPAAPYRLRVAGDPAALESPGGAARLVPLDLPREAIAVGLGALAEGEDEAAARCGELLAAGGAAIYRPSDGTDVPDFQLSEGRRVPRAHLLHAAVATGSPSLFVRFEPSEAEAAAAPLSDLLRLVLARCGGGAAAFAAVAESGGLLGAFLKRSPAAPGPPGPLLAFPAVRDLLSFAPERVSARALVLLAGFVAASGDAAGALRPLLRPAAPDGLLAHVHAAVFPYRPLARGPLSLVETVPALLERTPPQAVLHLLFDDRAGALAAESAVGRGVLWAGPIEGAA